jgi:hypothetical protein
MVQTVQENQAICQFIHNLIHHELDQRVND